MVWASARWFDDVSGSRMLDDDAEDRVQVPSRHPCSLESSLVKFSREEGDLPTGSRISSVFDVNAPDAAADAGGVAVPQDSSRDVRCPENLRASAQT